jgi:hypothetical protein
LAWSYVQSDTNASANLGNLDLEGNMISLFTTANFGSLQMSPFALVTGGTARSIGGYTATSDGATVGTDWLSAGAGMKFEFTQSWSFLADYEGVFFRSDAGQHYASAKVSYEW